jgi:hypothetical protein
MNIVKLEKLSNSQSAITSAYRASLILQEAGWTRYPAARWDMPAIVAFDGARCIAGINYSENENELIFGIDFAWCEKSHPMALVALVNRIRTIMRDSKCIEFEFTCHEGNNEMARLVRLIKATPVSHTYRMAI